MKQVGILHLSDFHFGFTPGPMALDKVRISEKLKRELPENDPRSIFFRMLTPLFGEQQVDLLAFTGDFGLGNNLESMSSGISYLSRIRSRLNINPDHVIIAPGNHDLDREAEGDRELDQLINACAKEGFSVATRLDPACIEVKGIPIIAINTCLGGTEHAYYGLPQDLWNVVSTVVTSFKDLSEKIETEIPEKIKSQLTALDIPAIGQSQFDRIIEHLQSFEGNCAILLGHHNLLPTHTMVVRPYAEIIDSGQLIFNLIGSERRILFLHGHTHCDSTLIAQSPEELESGFIACIGGNGLHSIPWGGEASVSYIKLMADDSSDFLAAVVSRYQKRGLNFVKVNRFPIWDEPTKKIDTNISIDELDFRLDFSFGEVAEKLNVENHETLAVELLRRRGLRQIEINDIHRPVGDWRIIRNP